jgi:hypothetical protein
LTENPKKQRQLGRHRPMWEDNIEENLKETGCKSVDSVHLAQGGIIGCL